MKIPSDVTRADIIIAMEPYMLGLHAERNRQIMARRLFDGLTFEQLAEEFELSDRQVKNIVYKSSTKIFKHIPIK